MSDSNMDTDKIKSLHIVGLKGIFSVLYSHRTFKKKPFILSIVISFLIFLLVIITGSRSKIYEILQITTDLILTIFPSLLGFSLGGYAIAVGFSNADLLRTASQDTKHSVYQKLSAIFALSILFQALATIIGISISWCIKANISDIFLFMYAPWLWNCVNSTLLLILFMIIIYSLVLTPYIVTNLFTLSQLNNLHYTIEKHNKVK